MSATQPVKIEDETILSSKLGQALKADQALYDCHLVVGEERQHLPAVKAVLAAFSVPLRAMLYDGHFQQCNGEVKLMQWTANACSAMISFMHSGKVEIDITLLPELLQLSNYCQVSELEKRCEEILAANLNLHNVLDVWAVAAKLGSKLVAQCKDVVYSSPSAILEDSKLQDCPVELLIDILHDDRLEVEEWCVYQAVKKLCQAHGRKRKLDEHREPQPVANELSKDLIGCVRLEFLNGEQLALVRMDGLFTADKILDAALNNMTGTYVQQPRGFPLRFDESRKGQGVTLLNNGKTASFTSDQCVLAVFPVPKTATYWEVLVESARNVYVGIAEKNIVDLNVNMGAGKGIAFRGRGATPSEKWNTGVKSPYGHHVQDGDRIGVSVNVSEGRIGFYVNGSHLGVAYDDLNPTHTYWPCVSSSTGRLTLLAASLPKPAK